jgi:hypothetical protein
MFLESYAWHAAANRRHDADHGEALKRRRFGRSARRRAKGSPIRYPAISWLVEIECNPIN